MPDLAASSPSLCAAERFALRFDVCLPQVGYDAHGYSYRDLEGSKVSACWHIHHVHNILAYIMCTPMLSHHIKFAMYGYD